MPENPCWANVAHGFTYKDKEGTPDGIQKLLLREGAVTGSGKILVKAKGLHLPALPELSTLATPVTLQLLNRTSGECWGAVFSAPFKRHDTLVFSDRAD